MTRHDIPTQTELTVSWETFWIISEGGEDVFNYLAVVVLVLQYGIYHRFACYARGCDVRSSAPRAPTRAAAATLRSRSGPTDELHRPHVSYTTYGTPFPSSGWNQWIGGKIEDSWPSAPLVDKLALSYLRNVSPRLSLMKLRYHFPIYITYIIIIKYL